MKPAEVSFLITLGRFTVSLNPLDSLLTEDVLFILVNLWTLDLLNSTPKNSPLSFCRFVIFVLVGLTVRPILSQNSVIFTRTSLLSRKEPLIPTIQSSAYLR